MYAFFGHLATEKSTKTWKLLSVVLAASHSRRQSTEPRKSSKAVLCSAEIEGEIPIGVHVVWNQNKEVYIPGGKSSNGLEPEVANAVGIGETKSEDLIVAVGLGNRCKDLFDVGIDVSGDEAYLVRGQQVGGAFLQNRELFLVLLAEDVFIERVWNPDGKQWRARDDGGSSFELGTSRSGEKIDITRQCHLSRMEVVNSSAYTERSLYFRSPQAPTSGVTSPSSSSCGKSAVIYSTFPPRRTPLFYPLLCLYWFTNAETNSTNLFLLPARQLRDFFEDLVHFAGRSPLPFWP